MPPEKFLHVQAVSGDYIYPTRSNPSDAGLDLYAAEAVTLKMGTVTKIRTGVAMAIPEGHVGLICDRSSMGAKGIKVMGGVVDSGYRGEVLVALAAVACETYDIQLGDRIAQILIIPIITPDVLLVGKLDSGDRGDAGFGSTGV